MNDETPDEFVFQTGLSVRSTASGTMRFIATPKRRITREEFANYLQVVINAEENDRLYLHGIINFISMTQLPTISHITLSNCDVRTISGNYCGLHVQILKNHTRLEIDTNLCLSCARLDVDGFTLQNSNLWPGNLPCIDNPGEYILTYLASFCTPACEITLGGVYLGDRLFRIDIRPV